MVSTARVTVYNFLLVQDGFESARSSHFKATKEAILASFGGNAIEATAEEVEASEVQPDGTYRKLESEWGTLA